MIEQIAKQIERDLYDADQANKCRDFQDDRAAWISDAMDHAGLSRSEAVSAWHFNQAYYGLRYEA